jgi:hypothetical protein
MNDEKDYVCSLLAELYTEEKLTVRENYVKEPKIRKKSVSCKKFPNSTSVSYVILASTSVTHSLSPNRSIILKACLLLCLCSIPNLHFFLLFSFFLHQTMKVDTYLVVVVVIARHFGRLALILRCCTQSK